MKMQIHFRGIRHKVRQSKAMDRQTNIQEATESKIKIYQNPIIISIQPLKGSLKEKGQFIKS